MTTFDETRPVRLVDAAELRPAEFGRDPGPVPVRWGEISGLSAGFMVPTGQLWTDFTIDVSQSGMLRLEPYPSRATIQPVWARPLRVPFHGSTLAEILDTCQDALTRVGAPDICWFAAIDNLRELDALMTEPFVELICGPVIVPHSVLDNGNFDSLHNTRVAWNGLLSERVGTRRTTHVAGIGSGTEILVLECREPGRWHASTTPQAEIQVSVEGSGFTTLADVLVWAQHIYNHLLAEDGPRPIRPQFAVGKEASHEVALSIVVG